MTMSDDPFLRAILDEEPTHAAAVLRLSQLYESTGHDADLAELPWTAGPPPIGVAL